MKGDEHAARPRMDAYIAADRQMRLRRSRVLLRRERHPNPPQPAQVLDQGALNRVRGDADLLRELASIFLDELPKWRAALADGLARSDGELVGRTAHCLKGSLGMFADHEAYSAAEALEMMAHDGQLTDCPAALAELDRALGALVPTINEFATRGRP